MIHDFQKYFKISGLTLFCLVFLSCTKEKDFDCLKSTGTIIKEERESAPFTKINLRDNIHLIFVESDEQKIVVEAGKHLLPKIQTRIVNDSLILENNNYCDWVRSYQKLVKIYIYGNPGLKLYNNGYGTVSGKLSGDSFFIKSWSFENMDFELNLGYLWLETFRSGTTRLSGKAKTIYAFRHNVGPIDARSMTVCEELLFHDHGQGLSYGRADSSLIVRIFDSGSIQIDGDPFEQHIERHGSGMVYFH